MMVAKIAFELSTLFDQDARSRLKRAVYMFLWAVHCKFALGNAIRVAAGEMTAAQIDAAVATMALNPLYSANVKIVREGEHGRDATAGGV